MIVYNTHQKIDALNAIAPESFVFVLDTTDRSFLYKSHNSDRCVDLIFGIDELHDLEKLTSSKTYHSHDEGDAILKIQKTSENTLLGICLSRSDHSDRQVQDLDSYFKTTERSN